MENQKYQYSIMKGGRQFVLRTDDPADILAFCGIATITSGTITDQMISAERIDNGKKPEVSTEKPLPVNNPIPPTAPPAIPAELVEIGGQPLPWEESEAGCKHINVTPLQGVGVKGPWEMQKCNDCGAARFRNTNKKTGAKFWGGWLPPKE